MRPDKKKKGRGKYAGKSESIQGKDISKDEHSKEPGTSENTETSRPNDSEKTKPAVDETPPPTKESNDSQPAPALRRETDALKETNKPWKRQIFSNWKEYDKPIISEMDDEEHFHDFASLMECNVSGDSYFKFKHEKLWENESSCLNTDLFNLNLKQLSAGLECIPFYERLNIPSHIFSEHEVLRMKNAAKKQEIVYEKLLKSAETNTVDIMHTSNDKSNFKENIKPQSVNEPNLDNVAPKIQLKDEYCMDMENVWAMDDTSTCTDDNVKDGIKVSETPSVNEIMVVESKDTKLVENEPSPNKINAEPKKVEVCDVALIENKTYQSEEKELKLPQREINVKVEKEVSGDANAPSEAEKSDYQMESVALSSSPKEARSIFGNPSQGAEGRRAPRSRRLKDKSQNKVSNKTEEEEHVLDSLLSLKEPTISTLDSNKREPEGETEADSLTNDLKSIVIHEKKENLEDWLDSMLDD